MNDFFYKYEAEIFSALAVLACAVVVLDIVFWR
jgi:hypothetical protein